MLFLQILLYFLDGCDEGGNFLLAQSCRKFGFDCINFGRNLTVKFECLFGRGNFFKSAVVGDGTAGDKPVFLHNLQHRGDGRATYAERLFNIPLENIVILVFVQIADNPAVSTRQAIDVASGSRKGVSVINHSFE